MPIFPMIVIGALIFGACYLVDKGFSKAFRSKAQHMSGLAVRANKRYGIFGVILTVLGILAICVGLSDGPVLIVGGVIVLLMGIGLAAHYLSFGIFYDEDTFLLCSFGRKSRSYHYRDIQAQKLYIIQGGNVLVELYLKDGTSTSVQSTMDGIYPFLDTAFSGWCRQRKVNPESCSFHDPSKHWWFPHEEEEG